MDIAHCCFTGNGQTRQQNSLALTICGFWTRQQNPLEIQICIARSINRDEARLAHAIGAQLLKENV